jgi:glutamate/tyrosine decarboxylase-like PLP-dependent enzyme
MGMHEYDETTDDLAWAVFRYALNRIRMDPPLDGPLTVEQLRDAVGQTITRDGLGGDEALAVFADHLAPACISADHPRYLAFVPGAPSEAAALFDLVVGASSFCGTSWLDASGAVYAENQALRWISDLAGMPAEAGGCFVSGGTMGNLSALVAARDQAGRRSGRPRVGKAAGREGRSAGLSWLPTAPIRPWRRRPGSWT